MKRWLRTTRCLDEAVAMLSTGFPGLELSSNSRARFVFEHSGVADAKWSIQRLVIRGSGSATGSLAEPFAAGMLRAGRVSISYGSAVVDTSAPYLRPLGASEMWFEDPSLEMLVFAPGPYWHRAQKHLRGTSRRLVVPTGRDTAPVSTRAARHWEASVSYVQSVVADAELFGSRLIRDQAYDLALRTFLVAFPVTADAVSVPDVRTLTPPAAIRRAMDHIDGHVAEAVSIADLALVAGLSVRALHSGFRRHVGVSAMQYLRDRRLDAVHEDLRDSDPAVTTVSHVAHRWGFTHLSRFSADYRRRFGHYPRDTLRR